MGLSLQYRSSPDEVGASLSHPRSAQCAQGEGRKSMYRIMRFCICFFIILMSCVLTERGWVKEVQEDIISLSRMVESADPQTLNYKMVIHDMGRTEYVPGETREPNPGFIFMIAEINIKQKKLTIEKNDIYFIDTSGTKWYGYFYTPIIYPIDTWAGIKVLVSKAALKITSEGIPDIRSDRIVAVAKGSLETTVTIKKANTGGLAVDVIKMLFEVPESKNEELKLMFLTRLLRKLRLRELLKVNKKILLLKSPSRAWILQKKSSSPCISILELRPNPWSKKEMRSSWGKK